MRFFFGAGWAMAVLGACFVRPGWAAPVCPASVDATIMPSGVPVGATIYVDGNPPVKEGTPRMRMALQAILFSEGPPEQQSWLSPGVSTARQNSWDFAAAHDSDVWMSCRYASSMLLATPIAASVKACVVSLSAGGQPSGLLCR